jgi:hypothetical protein
MPSSGMLRHVALVRADISEECIASIIRVTRMGKLGMSASSHSISSQNALLLVTADVTSSPILVIFMMELIHSSETSVLTRATWHNVPEDGILYTYQICHATITCTSIIKDLGIYFDSKLHFNNHADYIFCECI